VPKSTKGNIMKRLPDEVVKFARTNEVLSNPYIGFTSFQHFRDEPLFSDTGTALGWVKERYPVYDWVEQNGREQGFYPDTEIAYIRMLWKDIEPNEGEFDFSVTDEIFKKAEAKNQSVIFRLMPHTTRENEDVPDWLRTKIDCPSRPSSARVKDSPIDPLFLKKFACAIEAFGTRYDGVDNFYAMDISLTGAWGEGHKFENYSVDDLKILVDTYTRTFKHTHLVGQICSPELVLYANETKPTGFRGDGLGDKHHMEEYYPNHIYRMCDVWKKAPVMFETFWYISEWKTQEWDIDEIIALSLKWHVSSINAKSSSIPFEWKDKIDAWLNKMGYRFSVRLFEYPKTACAGDILVTNMLIENNGVAPIYSPLPLIFRLKSEGTEYILKTGVDTRNWMPGDTLENIEIKLPDNIQSGEYTLEFKLGGGKYPTIKFATDTTVSDDGYYYLTTVTIEYC
jgi:hypothetical protein